MELTLSFQEYFLRSNRNLVSIDDFTEFLSVFQNIIYLIAEEKGYKKSNKDFRFLIKKIKLDSFDCVIEPFRKSKDIIEKDPVEIMVDEFKVISKLIDVRDREESYLKLKEKVKKPENRISLYNYFERIIPQENKAFQIFTKERTDPSSERIFVSKKRYRKNIEAWRKMDKTIKPKIETFIGIVKTLDAYNKNKKFIQFVNQKGIKIKYFYDDEEIDRFTKLYDSDIIKISGEYDPYQKIIIKLTMFDKIKSVELSKLKDLKFKHPIKFELEYKYNAIFAYNKDYDLYAIGSIYNEMRQDLYNRIKSTIELYLNPHIKFTAASKEYRKKFLEAFSIKSLN